jgi:hypothetical protein
MKTKQQASDFSKKKEKFFINKMAECVTTSTSLALSLLLHYPNKTFDRI